MSVAQTLYILATVLERADNDLLWLAISIVLASAISAYFYLRVVAYMYFEDQPDTASEVREVPSTLLNVGILVMVVGVLLLGIFSGSVVDLANDWTNGLSITGVINP